MERHSHNQKHATQRRWSTPWRKRCSCGNELPCVVRTMLDRQRHFVGDAAPGWSTPPTAIARAAVRPAVPATTEVPVTPGSDRPLLTPGQRSCSGPVGAAGDQERRYREFLQAAREWQRDERRRRARGAR